MHQVCFCTRDFEEAHLRCRCGSPFGARHLARWRCDFLQALWGFLGRQNALAQTCLQKNPAESCSEAGTPSMTSLLVSLRGTMGARNGKRLKRLFRGRTRRTPAFLRHSALRPDDDRLCTLGMFCANDPRPEDDRLYTLWRFCCRTTCVRMMTACTPSGCLRLRPASLR